MQNCSTPHPILPFDTLKNIAAITSTRRAGFKLGRCLCAVLTLVTLSAAASLDAGAQSLPATEQPGASAGVPAGIIEESAPLTPDTAPTIPPQDGAMQRTLDAFEYMFEVTGSIAPEKAAGSPIIAYLTIIIALSLVVLVLGALLLRSKGYGRIRQLSHDVVTLRTERDRAESLLSARRGINILWDHGQAQLSGQLPSACGVPQDIDQILDFNGWLSTESANRLERATNNLRQRGENFEMLVSTSTNLRLAAEGITTGGWALLSVRAVNDIERENAVLRERNAQISDDYQAIRGLVDALPMPVWLRDQSGNIYWANTSYTDQLNHPEGASDGTLDTTSYPEFLSETSQQKITDALERGDRFHATLQDVQGTKNPTYEIIATTTDHGVATAALDISHLIGLQRKQTHLIETHRQSLNALRVAVAEFDADRKLHLFNKAFSEIWDLDVNWLDTSPTEGAILDRLRERGKLPEQADYQKWKQKYLDGHRQPGVYEELWFLPDGRSLKLICETSETAESTYLYENMTEQFQLESRYASLTKHQRETLDNLKEGVAQFSSDGLLSLYNPAFATMWQLNNEILQARPHINLIIEQARSAVDHQQFWNTLYMRVTSVEDMRKPFQARITRNDQRILDCTARPLPDGGTLLTFTDVTDSATAERALRERNDALERADQVKNTFIHHVSYVLRAPLTTVIGYADLLAQKEATNFSVSQKEFIDHILTASQSLLAIVNDILDLATIDADAMELNLQAVSPSDVMRSAVSGLQDRLRENHLTLEFQDPPSSGTFVADEARIKQILFNLLTNAITHSLPGAKVKMRCVASEETVSFSVSDSGPGVADSVRSTLFERFESGASAGGARGVGLGLSLVKSLVELHDGRINMRSNSKDGTTITCIFPRTHAPDDHQQPETAPQSTASPAKITNAAQKKI